MLHGPNLDPPPAARAERRVRRGEPGFIALLAAAVFLLFCQLLVGTDFYFAAAVFAYHLVVLFTLRSIGFGSVAGILIGWMAFTYVSLAEVLKTFYGQPGDSNLAAPDVTITVLLVGTASVCAAAVVAAHILRDRRIVRVRTEPRVLEQARNLSLAIGLLFLIVNMSAGVTDTGQIAPGSFTAIARQFGGIIYLSIIAETWRVLAVSQGRRSLSPTLVLMLIGLIAVGFFFNSKAGMAYPVVIYLFASAAYRRYLTRRQLLMTAAALAGGIFIAYPAVQLLRAHRDLAGRVSFDTATEFLDQMLTDPQGLIDEWAAYKRRPDDSLYGRGLAYLGENDDLLGRFTLIANTDVIVAAVYQGDPYGWALIGRGLEMLMPTFLDPDKPREDTGDILTWHYGLRSWGVNGNPTTGIFADCYAALEWGGVAVIPFLVMLGLLTELQLSGRAIGGNLVGTYFTFQYLHPFVEDTLSNMVAAVIRGFPIELAFVLLIFYMADVLVDRRFRPKRGEFTSVYPKSDRSVFHRGDASKLISDDL